MTTGSVLAQFTITLSQAVSEQVAVEWHTADGTALAGVDYAAAKGTVLFAPGQTAKTVDILVYGRAVGSEDRSFFVEMLPPVNAILGASIGECIIHVDTTGSTPVTQIIVPTGPQGIQGQKGDDGHPGPKGDTPTAEDIADDEFAAKGTAALDHPDLTTIAETARRIAYVGEAKIATVVLADGDNLLAQSDLIGDVVDFSSVWLYPRIARGATFISPEWSIGSDGRLLVKGAVAGDKLYVCQYDMASSQAVTRQSRAALKRSYAEADYDMDDVESFEHGGTLTATDQVLLYEADGKGYWWGGAMPKVVPAGSTPVSSGGIGAGAWSPKDSSSLRSTLGEESGSQFIGVGAGRTQADKNADVISVLDEGAKADSTTGSNGTDSTAAFLSAIAKCKSTGKSLSIPKLANGYRLTAPVDVRGVNVLDSNATLYINHAGIGVIFGGNASNPDNPRQSFGSVIRVTGAAGLTTPDMRGIGIKGQHVHVERCDYLQLYANDAAPNSSTDYSCAYSNLFLKKVDTIQLYGENGGWINEVNFYLNRTNKILFVDGPYSHNHNKFYHGTMEGLGVIDLPIGNNNKFTGFRLERNKSNPSETLTINFGSETWDNSVQASWVSSPRYTNEPYNPNSMVTVTDDGLGNSVYNIQDLESDERVMFDLSPSTPFLSSINAQLTGTLNQNTDMDGVRYVKSLASGKFRCLTSSGGLLHDGRMFEFRNGDKIAFASDKALFRPLIYLYDQNGKALVTEPTDDIVSMPGKSWVNGAYTLGVNSKAFFALFKKTSQAKYFRIALNFGNATAGLDFEYARLTMRLPKDSTGVPRKGFDINPPTRVSALPYFNASDVSMANIGEGIPCYKTDMTEMKINLLRQRYSVSNIVGNVITVFGPSVQYFDLGSCFVVYTDSAGVNTQLAVSAISGSTITLSAAPPAEIVPGVSIDLIITKTKVLA